MEGKREMKQTKDRVMQAETQARAYTRTATVALTEANRMS